jgi:hypothetical protein
LKEINGFQNGFLAFFFILIISSGSLTMKTGNNKKLEKINWNCEQK